MTIFIPNTLEKGLITLLESSNDMYKEPSYKRSLNLEFRDTSYCVCNACQHDYQISWSVQNCVYTVSFIKHLRQLCEDDRKPHQWENYTNCNGKLHVQFHDYPGGRVDTLTHVIERGLLIRYKPNIVLLQIGGNDCS